MAHVHRLVRPAADVLATTRALYDAGKADVVQPNYVCADLSGRCSSDLVVEQAGYGHLRLGSKGEEKWEPARTLSLKVPCRKCGPCRKARRMLWTDRAVREYRASTRSWFVTLTFRPEERYKLRLQAVKRLRDSGGDFERLSERDQFAELLREYQRPVSLYLMRLRKGLAKRGWELTSFRYILVPERHADGAPHFHAILHEVAEDQPLRKARIEEAWTHGVLHARLLKDERAARYAVKYLGKQDFCGRLRASRHYGEVSEPQQVAPFASVKEGLRGGAPPAPLAHDPAVAAQKLRELRRELFAEAEQVSEGDELGVCELGLHIGVSCDCGRKAARPECTAAGDDDESTDELSRFRRSRRGWIVPMPRLADLAVVPGTPSEASEPAPQPALPAPEKREEGEEGFDLDDTGWIDPDIWVHPDEAEGRDVLDVPGCVERPKRTGGR